MTYYKSIIKGKYLLQGTFKAESALKIASGASEESDSDVLLNSKGLPYIPGTSLAGAFYAALAEKSNLDKNELDNFWGRDNKRESHLDIAHCELASEVAPEIEIRDGIAINPKTQQTFKNAKYDYQVVPARLEFRYSIVVNDTGENGISKQVASFIAKIFEEGISIGGHKNKGKGFLKNLNATEGEKVATQHRYFDFTNKEHVYEWIDRDFNGGSVFTPAEVKLKKPNFQVTGSFFIPDALIIGSAAAANSSNESDKVHLKSGGNDILSGTSLKGALKARTRIIANTIGIENTDEMIDNLFGIKSDKNEKKPDEKKIEEAKKQPLSSRFVCNEPFIDEGVEYMQHRIKTDRFTGGTITGGKFDSTPLWSGTIANLSFKVNDATDNEIGLLLLVFADLYRGDIVFGGEKNIGRGVIKGKETTISIKKVIKESNKESSEEKESDFIINGEINDESLAELDEYVQRLRKTKEE